MILTVCSNADLLSVMILVRKIIDLLQIIAPVGLIIFASIDIIKAVISNKQDVIYSKLHQIPRCILAAIIVFFVPVIIDLVMSVADNTFEYAACFENANEEYVQDAYVSNAYEAVNLAENSLKMYDHDAALLLTNKIKDNDIKAALKDRLETILATINENNKNDARNESSSKKGTINIVSGSNSSSYGSTGQSTSGNVTFIDSNEVTKTALNHLGTAYVWGGESWSGGVDCSGFVYRVFNDVGHSMSRGTADSYRSLGCSVDSINDAKPGDLLIYGRRHVAIYLGVDTTGTKWRVHASGDQYCNGKTATNCQVKKDTNILALRAGESLTIRRLSGGC